MSPSQNGAHIMTIRLMHLPEITSTLGVGKTKLYAMIATKQFPAPIKMGKVSVWSSIEVEVWMKRLAIQQTLE